MLGYAACQVGGEAQYNRMAGGLGEMQEGLFKRGNQTGEQLGEQMKGPEHVVGLPESCQ